MTRLRLVLLALTWSFPGPLAQTSLVSPAEYANREGPQSTSLPFSVASLRHQQVDRSVQGSPRIFVGIAYRRDGCTTVTGAARVVEMGITLSDSSCPLSTTFAANYRPNVTTVFARTNVNFAAWPPLPDCPAPFDNDIPFQTPFVYVGSDDLLIETHVFANSTSTPYIADLAANLACWDSCSRELSPGCLVSGHSNPMAHTFSMQNCGGGALTISSALTDGPANSPYVLQLCPCPCPPLAGFCAPLHIAGGGCVPLVFGGTNSSGAAAFSTSLALVFDPCVLCSVCSQYAAFDVTSLTILLSNARCTKIPCQPVASACIGSVWALNSAALTATASANQALIVRLRM